MRTYRRLLIRPSKYKAFSNCYYDVHKSLHDKFFPDLESLGHSVNEVFVVFGTRRRERMKEILREIQKGFKGYLRTRNGKPIVLKNCGNHKFEPVGHDGTWIWLRCANKDCQEMKQVQDTIRNRKRCVYPIIVKNPTPKKWTPEVIEEALAWKRNEEWKKTPSSRIFGLEK